MKKIALLVDMTDSGKTAIQQAATLASTTGAELIAVHIAEDHGSDESHQNVVDWYVRQNAGEVPFKTFVGRGHFMESIPEILQGIHPDIVVVCTHGIHGITQHLFGAHILKLVKEIPYPSLVVQENSKISTSGVKNIMVTASPFDDYMKKIEMAVTLAKACQGKVIHYEVDKYLGGSEDKIASNLDLARIYCKSHGVELQEVKEDIQSLSLGYAQQTTQYAQSKSMDAIVLSSDTHQHDMAIGKADKEAFLTNAAGIPIIICPAK